MTGTLVLLRAFLRRDRWMYLWWPVGVAILYVSQGWSVDGLYTTQEEFDRAAAGMEGNAALIAMAGPARALNTTGGQVAWQSAAFGAILVGLMSMFIIGRHTRGEEETGRDELLRAAPVGRYAAMTAAVLDALLANLAVGALTSAGLIAYGLASADSIALGVGLALCGWFFTATALIGAQLTTSTRAAYGISGVVIGIAYGLRAIGDVSAPALSWLSPIGWYQAMHAFSGLRWWPALLLLAGAAVGTAAAYAIFDRRDYGAGVLASRPGPARAGRGLSSGLGLAWRLQRPAFLGWAIGLHGLRALVRSARRRRRRPGRRLRPQQGDDAAGQWRPRERLLRDHARDAGAARGRLCDLLGAAPARRGGGRAPGVRPRQCAAPLAVAGRARRHHRRRHGGRAGRRPVSGLGTTYALVTGDGDAVLRMTTGIVSYLPAVLVLSGVARLLYGVAPRASQGAWLLLLFASVVLLFGEVLNLPQWVQDLSPFEHPRSCRRRASAGRRSWR